jgi:hypothetical protein
MTVTLLWKCNELIVTKQELLRYYSNATKGLTCHNIVSAKTYGRLIKLRENKIRLRKNQGEKENDDDRKRNMQDPISVPCCNS